MADRAGRKPAYYIDCSLLAVVFLFSLISKWAESSIVTGPTVFAVAGLLMLFALPEPSTREIRRQAILVVAELALAVVLASDAAQTSLKQATRERKLPVRLLGFGSCWPAQERPW